jgi:hypothetical protein
MALWALRDMVLGHGALILVKSEEKMQRLMNSPRRRKPAQLPDLSGLESLF